MDLLCNNYFWVVVNYFVASNRDILQHYNIILPLFLADEI